MPDSLYGYCTAISAKANTISQKVHRTPSVAPMDSLNIVASDFHQQGALGKLIAYSIQDGPFVHIDNDVFLWKPLPQELLQAPVFAQCPEYFPRNSDRSSREIEAAFAASKAA